MKLFTFIGVIAVALVVAHFFGPAFGVGALLCCCFVIIK
jgi:hypothetical protein